MRGDTPRIGSSRRGLCPDAERPYPRGGYDSGDEAKVGTKGGRYQLRKPQPHPAHVILERQRRISGGHSRRAYNAQAVAPPYRVTLSGATAESNFAQSAKRANGAGSCGAYRVAMREQVPCIFVLFTAAGSPNSPIGARWPWFLCVSANAPLPEGGGV